MSNSGSNAGLNTASKKKLTREDLRDAAEKYKNWGKWGPQDEIGTLNYTAPEDIIAAAHHFGPHGEQPDGFNFVFRVLAGLVFTLVYRLRGFGVAVGCHACYDVLVGVAM